MDISLKGRNAIITGGSKGLGLAMAAQFAASGANVAIMARNREGLQEAVEQIGSGGGKVVPVSCDVADAASLKGGYEEAASALGQIDIVVNNAGESRALPFESVTDEIWQRDLELKLFAAVRMTRLAWPGMKERKWGRVINVLNIGAKAPRPSGAPTAVSRAAGMALTKVLSGEGAPHNILVNALLVGHIVSDQVVRQAEKAGIPLEEMIKKRSVDIPLGRMGRAEEFANIACFLASDAASYITGTAINVDGGKSHVV